MLRVDIDRFRVRFLLVLLNAESLTVAVLVLEDVSILITVKPLLLKVE